MTTKRFRDIVSHVYDFGFDIFDQTSFERNGNFHGRWWVVVGTSRLSLDDWFFCRAGNHVNSLGCEYNEQLFGERE